MGKRLHGRCLCGESRLQARVLKDEVDACRCGMCRRWAGVAHAEVEVAELEFASVAPRLVCRFSGSAERVSCARCGGGLASRMVDGSFANVPLAVFDPPLDLPLAVELFVEEKPSGYAFAGSTHKMTGAEVAAAFARKEG